MTKPAEPFHLFETVKTAVSTENSNPDIVVVKSAKDWA
jgi:hypothetical protein